MFVIVGLLVAVCSVCALISFATRVDYEALGETTANQFITIPTSVKQRSFYYFHLGQIYSDYMRFEMSSDEITSFLSMNCFGSLQNLESMDPPPDGDLPFGSHVPDWWNPDEAKSWIGNSCTQKNVGLKMWLAQNDNGGVIYLYLGQ
jgi:hypothetical protein